MTINVKLASKLANLYAKDQLMRDLAKNNKVLWDSKQEVSNTRVLKQIVNEYGWPVKSLVGDFAANAAWLIAQHSDMDIEFQEKCLDLMKLQTDGEVDLQNIAYLEDRICKNKNRAQIYGTQFINTPDGLRPWKIKSPNNVNERRRSMNLDSLESYQEQMNKIG